MNDEQRTLAKHMIDALENPDKPLTPWENSFYESVAEQFQDRGRLSERQLEILERIYTERTS